MAPLRQQRCLNHAAREAVCRCLGCGNFFCRECVVLFESRLLCAPCLAQASAQDAEDAKGRSKIGMAVWAVVAFLFIWLFFYLAGWTILQFRERAIAIATYASDSRVPL
jgi:hypothetical protein